MKHDPKLVEAMALAIEPAAFRAVLQVQNKEYFAGTIPLSQEQATLALDALCAHLRIPPDALRALADGEAVVVPRKATDEMNDAGWIDKEDVDPRDIYRAMLAASPYAREAGDE